MYRSQLQEVCIYNNEPRYESLALIAYCILIVIKAHLWFCQNQLKLCFEAKLLEVYLKMNNTFHLPGSNVGLRHKRVYSKQCHLPSDRAIKVSEYGQKMPQLYAADQPRAS